jgi:hypothetical protein
MTKRKSVEHPEVRDLEDTVWNLKDDVAYLNEHALTSSDRAAIAGIKRDIERTHERVRALLDHKRRPRAPRKTAEPAAAAAETAPEQQGLLGDAT